MFREILAEAAIKGRGWSLGRALGIARHVLLDNPRRIFGRGEGADG